MSILNICRYVACVIVGSLSKYGPSKPYMLHFAQLEKANHTTIAQLFQNALLVLWPSGILYDKVWLFLTDAAAYMRKAAKGLSVMFPRLIHSTCLAHGLHNVAYFLRVQFPMLNKLIATVKSVFVKAPNRVALFKELAPNVPLPPEPVVTRWGTWLAAVSYYAENWDAVKTVVMNLRDSDAESIRAA